VANAPRKVIRRLENRTDRLHLFAPQSNRIPAVWRALRCHQWSKNLLVFVPMLAGHDYASWPALRGALLMFIAWCFVASGIYISNGKGAVITLIGPTVTINNGGLVVI
jgi:hypothetical protein